MDVYRVVGFGVFRCLVGVRLFVDKYFFWGRFCVYFCVFVFFVGKLLFKTVFRCS